MKLLPTVFLVVTVCSFGASIDLLCPLKWPNCGLTVQNIVCERGETCPTEPGCEKIEPDEEFLKFILHEHNRLRNEIATGKETRGNTGPAANMNALSYDKGLEFTASCNANMCKFQHDKCRATKKFPNAGQNLFYASGNQSELRGAVAAWFEEITLNTPDVIDKFPKDRDNISRFIQTIWATSTHIGCAQAKKTGETEQYVLVCNYGPGVEVGKSVYEKGEVCSKCPESVKCNEQYPGLCGEADESPLNTPKEPPIGEISNDKDAAAGVGVGGAPGMGGFGGMGFGMGAGGGGSGSQSEQDKNNEKKKKTTKQQESTITTTYSTNSTYESTTNLTTESTSESPFSTTLDPENSTRRHDIGHFTQMIWAKTTHIGCAMAKSFNQQENVEEYYLTCNYAPQGNMIGKTVYERGTGCSKCPKSRKCNLKYPGLCGDVHETQIKQGSRGATMNEDSVTAESGSVASAATGGVTDRGVTEEGVTEKDITQEDAPKESAIAQNATENAITGNYTTDSSAENGTVTQQSVETTTHNSASIINSCLHLVIAIILVELLKD
ncbi:unnamed protein product [Phyllotreta striolata]|uniref:SCP domain-containing protein n=1 Tax=Phyllotreta striolata TaxID=444603 RepID=A0A9N9TJ29_PHYSR|nr:unnamed protein product [Phyllotreta striolata]